MTEVTLRNYRTSTSAENIRGISVVPVDLSRDLFDINEKLCIRFVNM